MINNNQNQSFRSIRLDSGAKRLKGAEHSFATISAPKDTHFYISDERGDGKLSCFALKASENKVFNKIFDWFPQVVTTLHTLFLRPFGTGTVKETLDKVHSKGGQELRPQAARKLLDSASQSLNIKLENRSNKP